MSEGQFELKITERALDNIERNFQGNESEALFSRLDNPVIKKQACDLMYTMSRFDTDDGKEVNDDGEESWPLDEFAPTYKDIEERYNHRLGDIKESTDVIYGKEPKFFSEAGISLHAINPDTGTRFTPKMLSIIEAHEKGHVIREYDGPQYDEYFQEGFDFNAIIIPEDLLKKIKISLVNNERDMPDNPDEVSDEIAKNYLLHYLFSGNEIAERMNQLKGYFGFTGTEQFTVEHLNIARDHYVQDTEMDNGMTYLFQAVTPSKEERFLYLINNSGV